MLHRLLSMVNKPMLAATALSLFAFNGVAAVKAEQHVAPHKSVVQSKTHHGVSTAQVALLGASDISAYNYNPNTIAPAYASKVAFVDPYTGKVRLNIPLLHVPINGGLSLDIHAVNTYRRMLSWDQFPHGSGYSASAFYTPSITVAPGITPYSYNNTSTQLPYFMDEEGKSHLFFPAKTSNQASTNSETTYYSHDGWKATLSVSQATFHTDMNSNITMSLFTGTVYSPDGKQYSIAPTNNGFSSVTQITNAAHTVWIKYAYSHPVFSQQASLTSITTSSGYSVTFSYAGRTMSDDTESILTGIKTSDGKVFGFGWGSQGINSISLPNKTNWSISRYNGEFTCGKLSIIDVLTGIGYPNGASQSFQNVCADNGKRLGIYKVGSESVNKLPPFKPISYSYSNSGSNAYTTVSYGTKQIHYTFDNPSIDHAAKWNSGLLLDKTIVDTGSGKTLQETKQTWQERKFSDDIGGGQPELTSRVITQDGATYTLKNITFNDYGYVTASTATGNDTRNIARTYYSDPTKWIFDLATEKVTNTTGQTLHSIANTYNSLGQLTSTNVDGVTTKRTYDGGGNLETVTNALGHVTTYKTYEYGHPSEIIGPTIKATGKPAFDQRFQMNPDGTIASQMDSFGNVTKYTYNGVGQITSIKHYVSSGTTLADAATTIEWNKPALGDQTLTKGNYQQVTIFSNNLLGQYQKQVTITDTATKQSRTTTATYGQDGNVIRMQIPNGKDSTVTKYMTYDALGRVLTTFHYKSGTGTLTNCRHMVIESTTGDPAPTPPTPKDGTLLDSFGSGMLWGHKGFWMFLVPGSSGNGGCFLSGSYHHEHDRNQHGVVNFESIPLAHYSMHAQAFYRNNNGYAHLYVQSNGNTINQVISHSNQPQHSVTVIPQKDVVFTLNGYNQGFDNSDYNDAQSIYWATIQDLPSQVTTTYTYGANSIKVTSPLGKAITTTYQNFDQPADKNVLTVTNGIGNVTTTKRDVMGRMLSITQNKLTRSYSYNPSEHFYLTSETDPELGTITYGRDALGQMTSRTIGGQTTDYIYNAAGQLINVNYPDNANNHDNISKTYDVDRLMSVANANGTWVYTYNPLGKVASATFTNAQGSDKFTYAYDQLDHLTSITYPDGQAMSYTPNAFGEATNVGPNITGVTYYQNGVLANYTTADGNTVTYGEDDQGRVNGLTVDHGATALINDSYGLDDDNNIATITDHLTSSNDESFTYNNANELLTAKGPWGEAALTYYPGGNIQTFNVGSSQQAYHYDTQNRLTSITGTQPQSFGYDVNGNMSGINGNILTFNAASQLVSAKTASDTTTFTYDGNGNRLSVNNSKEQLLQLYINNQLMYSQATVGSTTTKNDYLYLGHHLVAKDTNAGTYTYYYNNLLGSPIGASDSKSDGALLWQQHYAPFGKELTDLSSKRANTHIGYTGKELDQSIGLNYYNARYYDPAIGRFISYDPASVNPGSWLTFNRYAYAANNPYAYVDPTGMSWLSQGLDDIFGSGVFGIGMTYGFGDGYSGASFNAGVMNGFGSLNQMIGYTFGYAGGVVAWGGQALMPEIGGAAGLIGKAEEFGEDAVGFADSIENKITSYWPTNNGFLGKATNKTLESGAKIDRYGYPTGRFASPYQTPIEMRALPPQSKTDIYSAYRVIKPFEVEAGQVAPAFNQIGLGEQYLLPDSAERLVNSGYLQEVE